MPTKRKKKTKKSPARKDISASLRPPRDIVRNRFTTQRSFVSFKGVPHLTQQNFKEECDVNNIMARYTSTGAISHVARKLPQFADVGEESFHEAMNLVVGAQGMFMELPASVRARFGNDPGSFLDFVQDPANASELAQMGLTERGEQAPSEPPKEPENGSQAAQPPPADPPEADPREA